MLTALVSHSSLSQSDTSHVSCTRLAMRLVQLNVTALLELSKPSIRPFEVCYLQQNCKCFGFLKQQFVSQHCTSGAKLPKPLHQSFLNSPIAHFYV